jgi:hypothetical protein
MSNYGYSHGQPFGDPEGFTRSTQESEIDQFNQWMRAQPWWAGVQHNPQAVTQQLAQMGIHLPDSFHIDDAGNVNQKSRAGTIGKIAAIGGGAAAAMFGIPGLFPGLLSGGGAAAAGAGAGAIPELEGGATLAANLGGAGALPALGAGAGAAGAGAAANYIPPGAAAAEGGHNLLKTVLGMAPVGAGLVGKLASGGFGGGDNNPAGQMSPELQQMLQLSLQRMNQQQPLFDAVSKQALAGLPDYAKGGR